MADQRLVSDLRPLRQIHPAFAHAAKVLPCLRIVRAVVIGFEIGLGFDPTVIDALVGSLVLLTLVRVVTRKNRLG